MIKLKNSDEYEKLMLIRKLKRLKPSKSGKRLLCTEVGCQWKPQPGGACVLPRCLREETGCAACKWYGVLTGKCYNGASCYCFKLVAKSHWCPHWEKRLEKVGENDDRT